MRARTCGRSRVVFLAALFCVALAQGRLQGQSPAALPGNWQSLGPADFVQAVAPFYDLDAETLFYKTIDDDAVRTQAASLIATINYSQVQVDLPTLNIIHLLATPKLTFMDQTRIKSQLLARNDNWTGQPYSIFHAKWDLMRRVGLGDSRRMQEGTRWAQAGGQLSSVPPQDVPEAYLYFASTPPQVIAGSFSVHWSGQITAPNSGAYTISISPINVNSQDPRNPVQLAMTVNLGGNVILTANATQWTGASAPISLTSGQPVTLAVDWSAQVGQVMPNRALHAVLSWQGPGVNGSVVPQSALMLPDGSAAGLQATYNWTDVAGNAHTLSRTEPNIDVAWTSRPVWLLPDLSAQVQAGAAMLQTVTSSTYVNQYINQTPPVEMHQLHAVFQDPDATGQILSSAQRNILLSLIQSQPTLVDPVSPNEIATFYGAYRIGNSDACLQTFGTWAGRHANIVCGLAAVSQFDAINRDAYRRMGVYLSLQQPGQAAQLQSQFLQTPDGRCCLPAAYTLAYCYLAANQLPAWISLLNSHLGDSTLTGDLRVNWLLARAQAQEISHSKGLKYLGSSVSSRLAEGMPFVTQASGAAQSAGVKLRTALELAARLVSLGQFDAATNTLQPLVSSAPAVQQGLLTTWLNQIAALKVAQASSAANQSPAALQSYLETLRQRRDHAAAQGNTAEVNRYNAIINALTSQ
jgi:hypothetical protein